MKRNLLLITLIVITGLTHSQNAFQKSHSYGFVENNGQIVDQTGKPNSDVKFNLSVCALMNVQLRLDGFSYETFQKVDSKTADSKNPDQFIFNRLDVEFIGANADVELVSEQKADDYLNYYTTGMTNNNAFKTSHFQKIIYVDLYPGIDLVFYTNLQAGIKVKYDFIVHPGADLSVVQLRYSGFENADFSETQLNFITSNGIISEKIPASWWQESGEKTNVNYKLISTEKNNLLVGFENTTGTNFSQQTLIVDPEPDLNWATYYGDTLTDIGTAIITDNYGYIYATGYTQSFTNLATSGVHQDTLAGGMYDVYITKFQQNAVRLWSTYYGGTGWEESRSIIVDTLFNVTVTGFTDSPDGIASDSAYQQTINPGTIDAFVAKFDDNGLRIWSTYFGGEGDDFGNGIDTDFDGFIFVTGSTENSNSGIASSGSFQSTSNGMSDAFLVKIDTLGIPMWSTYFGGSDEDFGSAVSEESGSIYVTGTTQSADLITTVGAYQNSYAGNKDAFITKFLADGNLNWSTFFGGPEIENGNDIEIFNAKIYCVGETQSSNQIADVGAFSENLSGTRDAFVTRFDTLGTKIWSTYYGKSGDENAVGIALEFDGGIYITGSTNSDSIATPDTYDTTYNGGTDVYLAKLTEYGVEEWCSYYGASGEDVVKGIDVYGNTSVYLTGFTNSLDSIATWGPFFQPTFGGGDFDAFIARFTTYKSTPPGNGVCMGGGNGSGGGGGGVGIPSCQLASETFCEGELVLLTSAGGSLGTGANWNWFVDGCGEFGTLIAIGDTLSVYPPVGTTSYYLSAVGVNNSTPCTIITVTVLENPIASASISDDTLCYGEATNVSGTGGAYFNWSGPNSFSSQNQNETVDSVSTINSGNYIFTVCELGCFDSDTVSLYVIPSADITFTISNTICQNDSTGSATANVVGVSPFTYFWSPNSSTDSLAENLSAGIYYLTLTDGNNCSFSDSVEILSPAPFNIDISSTVAFCNSPTGSANVVATGLNSPFTYFWPASGDTLLTAINLYPGWATVIITNSLGCEQTDSIYVDSLNNLLIDAIVLQDESCVGFSDGSAQVQFISGAAPFAVFWNPNGEISDLITGLSPGEYIVHVVDSNSCHSLDTVFINSADSIIISTQNIIDPTCGDSNGELEVFATGGNGTLSYFWNPTNQSGNYITNLDSGNYSVTVTDENNCEETITIFIFQTGIFDVVIEGDLTTIHEGEISNLSSNIEPDFGTYNYSWSPDLNCLNCSTIEVSPPVTSTYSLIVTNEFGCIDTAEILITVLPCIDPFIPTIFSPNGDGLNDDWSVFGTCINAIHISVFNRWGEVIFTTEIQSQVWNGTYKDLPVPGGNYTYQIEMELKSSETISESGIITVVR